MTAARPHARGVVVTLDGYRSLVSGWGAARLVRRATGRHPMWVSRLKGYSVSETTAAEVIALAESDGIPVVLTHPPRQADTDASAGEERTEVAKETADEAEGGLW